jgi:hypothetical protein
MDILEVEGFTPFLDEYYKYWMHSWVLDALVKIGCIHEYWMHSWVLDAPRGLDAPTYWMHSWILDALMSIGCTHEYWMHS